MKKVLLLSSLMLLFLFPSCTRMINWAKVRLHQGCCVSAECGVPQEHMRSIRVYDQFNTMAMFTAIWLTPDVLSAYVHSYSTHNLMTPEQQERMLDAQLEQNKQFISFYLLSYWPDNRGCGNRMDQPNPRWSMTLHLGDKSYSPVFIKKVDLPCEFHKFFKPYYNRFRTAYLVRFDAFDRDGKSLLPVPGQMTICFKSLVRGTSLSWEIDQQGNNIAPADLYYENHCTIPDICAICGSTEGGHCPHCMGLHNKVKA